MARFAPIRTERLLIRSLEPGDAEALYAYKRTPEATQYQFWRPQSLEEIERFIADMGQVEVDAPGQWLQLAVCLRDAGDMVGDIGIKFAEGGSLQAEIGYTISPAQQRKGYATEAVGAAVGYLFNTLGKRRITASVDPRNTPSVAVLERLGFRREAHFVQSLYMDGDWRDDCVYAMQNREWNRFT